MKKVLLISYNSCYPLFHGGAIAQYYFIDGLKDQVEFVLCTEVHNEKELKNLKELKLKQPTLKVYALNTIQPVLSQNKFRNFVKKVFWPSQKQNLNIQPNSDDFSDPYFQHADNKHSVEFVKLINDVIVKEKIAQVQFDFYNTIDLCWAIPRNVRKIFIHHEVRFKRLQLAYDKSEFSPAFKQYLIDKTRLYELACIREIDEVVVFNEDDADLLRADCKSITVSPFGVPDELIFKKNVSNAFDNLFFVGGEGHTPNLLGLTWFLDEIYIPNLNKIKYPIRIIGDWSENVKNNYKAHSEIIFCGVVDSIEPYFENSVFVNPILTGAGLRTKVLHAFANKVPVVSTRFGAEGCFTKEENKHLGLFDNAGEFMDVIENTNFSQLADLGNIYHIRNFNKDRLLNVRVAIYKQ